MSEPGLIDAAKKLLIESNKGITAPTLLAQLAMMKKGYASAVCPNDQRRAELVRAAVEEVQRTPALAECTTESLFTCLCTSLELNLRVGSALGHMYFVPFAKIATPIIGYRGIIELALEHPDVLSVHPFIVYENEKFTAYGGSNPRIEHEIIFDEKTRGNPVAVYATWQLRNGGSTCSRIIPWAEIDRLAENQINRSKKNADRNAWATSKPEMALKTPIRRTKNVPMTDRLGRAMMIEELHERGGHLAIGDDLTTVIDVEGHLEPEPPAAPPAGRQSTRTRPVEAESSVSAPTQEYDLPSHWESVAPKEKEQLRTLARQLDPPVDGLVDQFLRPLVEKHAGFKGTAEALETMLKRQGEPEPTGQGSLL